MSVFRDAASCGGCGKDRHDGSCTIPLVRRDGPSVMRGFGGFVMDLPVGAWLITAPGGSDGPPRVLRQCASLRECQDMASRYGLPDLVFVQVGAAEHWKAAS